jgi:hypothetical protein
MPTSQARGGPMTGHNSPVDGQGQAIGTLAGTTAEAAALSSFVQGLRGALLVSSALALAAAAVALVGLRDQRDGAAVRASEASEQAARHDAAAA